MSEFEYEYALKAMKTVLSISFRYNLSDDEILSIMFEYKYGYKYDVLKRSGKCHCIGPYTSTRIGRYPSFIKDDHRIKTVNLYPSLHDREGNLNDIYKNININIRCHNHKDVDDSTYNEIRNTYRLLNIPNARSKYMSAHQLDAIHHCKEFNRKEPLCGLSPEAQAEIDFIEALSSNLSEKIPEDKKKLWIDEYNALKEEYLKQKQIQEDAHKKHIDEIALKKKIEEEAKLIRENELKKENEKKYNHTYNMLMASFTK